MTPCQKAGSLRAGLSEGRPWLWTALISSESITGVQREEEETGSGGAAEGAEELDLEGAGGWEAGGGEEGRSSHSSVEALPSLTPRSSERVERLAWARRV